jgi:hypothetical protein
MVLLEPHHHLDVHTAKYLATGWRPQIESQQPVACPRQLDRNARDKLRFSLAAVPAPQAMACSAEGEAAAMKCLEEYIKGRVVVGEESVKECVKELGWSPNWFPWLVQLPRPGLCWPSHPPAREDRRSPKDLSWSAVLGWEIDWEAPLWGAAGSPDVLVLR